MSSMCDFSQSQEGASEGASDPSEWSCRLCADSLWCWGLTSGPEPFLQPPPACVLRVILFVLSLH